MNSELEIEEYDLVRLDQFRRGRGVSCFVKICVSYSWKPNFALIQNIFIEIFLPKPVLIDPLYRPD